MGYRGDADSLFPSWCTTIFIILKQLLNCRAAPEHSRAMSEGYAPLVQRLGCQRRSGSGGYAELLQIISRAQILESRCRWMVLGSRSFCGVISPEFLAYANPNMIRWLGQSSGILFFRMIWRPVSSGGWVPLMIAAMISGAR